jgi:AbrB family looped-hinge helix DNA binding protein
MPYLKLSSKNQIVLPKAARDAMKLKGGDEILIVVKGDMTLLMPKPKKYAEALSGKGKGVYPKNYIKKERLAW